MHHNLIYCWKIPTGSNPACIAIHIIPLGHQRLLISCSYPRNWVEEVVMFKRSERLTTCVGTLTPSWVFVVFTLLRYSSNVKKRLLFIFAQQDRFSTWLTRFTENILLGNLFKMFFNTIYAFNHVDLSAYIEQN